MFVDFSKVFNNIPQTELRIPDELIKHLSSSLPAGLTYEDDGTGNLMLKVEQGHHTISGFSLEPSNEQKLILGENYSGEDVLQYCYNAQDPILIKLEKEGEIIIDGTEVGIDKLFLNPYSPINYKKGSAYIEPDSFPEPFPILFACEKYSTTLLVHRIPNRSVHVNAYKSESDKPLQVQYTIDESQKKVSFHISFNSEYAKTIRDIVESTTIYNAFVDGKGTINGTTFSAIDKIDPKKKYDSDSIAFWEKVLRIEEVLNFSFNPDNAEADYHMLLEIEQLYQNLINEKPVRINKRTEYLTGSWDPKVEEYIKTQINCPTYFEYQKISQMSILGESISLPCLVGIINAKISLLP